MLLVLVEFLGLELDQICYLLVSAVLCILSGLPGDYRMPFEDEVGLHPTLEEMQDVVVSSRKRPQFKPHWLKNEVVSFVCALFVHSLADLHRHFRTSNNYKLY